jgi:glycosyltransferase involved in cell wall biosynthesis
VSSSGSTQQGQILPLQALKLFIVVPAFNEAGNIENVIREIQALSLPGVTIEFAVIDDGSSDETRAMAQTQGSRVISLPFNMGIGMSVQTGFRYAVDRGADLVVQVDGDGQHIPEEITKLLRPILDNKADVVIGTRFSKGQKEGIQSTTFLRWFAGRVLSFAVYALARQKVTDTTSGFRLYNRKAAKFVATSYPDDYPEVEVILTLARQGIRIIEVPVQMRSRAFGSSSINWWRAVYYVIKVLFVLVLGRVRR